MQEKQTPENTKQTSIRLPIEIYKKIVELSKKSDRKPAEQIRYMLKEYIRIIENSR